MRGQRKSLFTVRLTHDERRCVEKLAEMQQASLSEVVRTMIRQNSRGIVTNEKTGAKVSTAHPGLHE